MGVNKVVLGATTIVDISDSTVTAEKLMKGQTAYGADGEKIIGTLEPGIDTSSATATADDIAYQKTAYVNGGKVTGTLKDSGGINATTSSVATAMGGAFVRLSATANENLIIREGDAINLNTLLGNLGDATADDVVQGKTFTSSAGLKAAGTIRKAYGGLSVYDVVPSKAGGGMPYVEISTEVTEPTLISPNSGPGVYLYAPYSEFGNATAEDVAAGKTFTSAAGLMVTGTAVSPVTYTPLVYLESSGEQYIDTGISGGTNAAYELKFNVHNLVGQHYEHYFAGDYSTKVPRLYCVGGWNSVSASNPGSAAESHVVVEKSVNADHVLRYEPDGSLYVNGTLKYTMGDASDTGWGSLSWYLFNSHSEPGLKSIMKLYYLKMWTDGVLVRDFVPVQRVDGTCCLLDNVSGEFFENAGTGEFTGASATALAAEYAEALRIVGVSV